MLILKLWRRHVPDPSHGLERQLVEERRLTVHHLNHHYAQRPDVHFGAVCLTGNHFRSHPVGSSDQRLSLLYFYRNLSTESEVTQLDLE